MAEAKTDKAAKPAKAPKAEKAAEAQKPVHHTIKIEPVP